MKINQSIAQCRILLLINKKNTIQLMTQYLWQAWFCFYWQWIVITRAPSQYKEGFSRYGDSHYEDKTVVKLFYLYNGNSYTSKTVFLYWDGPRSSKSIWRCYLISEEILFAEIETFILLQRCQPLLILLNHYSFWCSKSPFLLNISKGNQEN